MSLIALLILQAVTRPANAKGGEMSVNLVLGH